MIPEPPDDQLPELAGGGLEGDGPAVSPHQIPLGGMPGSSLAVSRASYSGPLPPWQQYQGYEQVLHGSADRILTMAELDQRHQIDMDRRSADLDVQVQRTTTDIIRRGQWQGFALALVLLVGGIALVLAGQDVAGLALIGAELGGILGVYALRTFRQKQREDPPASEISSSRH